MRFKCPKCNHILSVLDSEANEVGDPICPECDHEFMEGADPHGDLDEFLQDANMKLHEMWTDEYGGSEMGSTELIALNETLEMFFGDKVNE